MADRPSCSTCRTMAGAVLELRPQPGPQEHFLGTPADIAIMGGSVFGGKTWALTVEPIRHLANPGFTFAGFRRVFDAHAEFAQHVFQNSPFQLVRGFGILRHYRGVLLYKLLPENGDLPIGIFVGEGSLKPNHLEPGHLFHNVIHVIRVPVPRSAFSQ